jgi:GTP-binding protein HflX
VLIDRQGRIAHTFVGEPTRIYLPDVGRARVGSSHLRGLRHVHTVLQRGKQRAGLQREDFADLSKLRLDCVASLAVNDAGEPGELQYASLASAERQKARSVHQLQLDLVAYIAAAEQAQARLAATKPADDGRERAIVVGVYPDKQSAEWHLEEIRELADTAGVHVVDSLVQLRQRVDPRFVVGSGKLEEAVLMALEADASLMIIDHALTPAQARAVCKGADLRVLDRNQLILDIFAQHAKSRDGKLQVELAQLKYTLPRLTDLDAGLSRLTGGIGGRGPGETKLEINRRRARERIGKLEKQIDQLSRQRGLRRQRRQHAAQPIIGVVGYTNAGKSTLLNALTGSAALVADQLFATLDPTSRRLHLGEGRQAVITDTVGFIRELPDDLINAFRATLEELHGADLLLHVADCSDPRCEAKMEAVVATLAELKLSHLPQLLVLNKMDRQDPFVSRALQVKWRGVGVSATEKTGFADLLQEIVQRLPAPEAAVDMGRPKP